MSRRPPWLTFEAALAAAAAGFLLQAPFERALTQHGGPGIVTFEHASAGRARDIVAGWSRAGALPAARIQLLIDCLFVAAYTTALVLAFVVARRAFGPTSWRGRLVSGCVGAAVLPGLCDIVENVGLYRALAPVSAGTAPMRLRDYLLAGAVVLGATVVVLVVKRLLRGQPLLLVSVGTVAAVLAVVVLNRAGMFHGLVGGDSWAAPWARVKFDVAKVLVPLAVLAVGVALINRKVRKEWREAHRGLGRWLSGVPVPCEPIGGPLPRVPPDDTVPESVAICCSGGGIRSASFNLGALQAFMADGTYQKADVITGVSGGGYVAAAIAIARSESDEGVLTPERRAFAPGSPEEQRLRTHMRYLIPDGRAVVIGVLALLFGFAANLGAVLAGCYIGGRILGWSLHAWRVAPEAAALNARAHVPAWIGWTVLSLVVAGLLAYLVERVVNVYVAARPPAVESQRTWAVRLLAAGAVTGALLVGVPVVTTGLYNLGLENRPTVEVARVISAIGFTTERGCLAAAEAAKAKAIRAASEDPAAHTIRYGTCGREFTGIVDGDRLRNALDNEGAAAPGGTAAALLAALLALIKTTVGRVGAGAKKAADADPTTKARTGRFAGVPDIVRRTVAPWLGSAVAAALILVYFLRVTQDAMLGGITPPRLAQVIVAAAALAVLPFFTDANRTSLHPMYRERLASVFAVRRTGREKAEQVPYAEPLRFSGLHEWSEAKRSGAGGPKLVLCATVNVDDVGLVPPGRGGAPFVFSRKQVGIPPGGRKEPGLYLPLTTTYEQATGSRLLTLPAAVAISGAAVSPVMGRMTKPPVRFLLGLANVRLGVWLLNPSRVSDERPPPPPPAAVAPPPKDPLWKRAYDGVKQLPGRVYRGGKAVGHRVRQYVMAWDEDPGLAWWSHGPVRRALQQWMTPGVTCLLREMSGRNSINRKYLYVTDGGHYDNYGLLEALRRQPTKIYVFDGSGDTPPVWTTLGHAISIARADLGVEIELDAPPPAPGDDGRLSTNVVRGWATYPGGRRARLIVGKLGLVHAVPYDLDTYAHDDPTFPNRSTADQLYGDIEFESYRTLGTRTARAMLIDDEPDFWNST